MSARIQRPVGQKRLTNVAVVRLKRMGKRFEIATYPNKVVNWRNGVERDLDEVLQAEAVYENVSKGKLAKKRDLERAFGTSDAKEVCVLILRDGELQEGEKERRVKFEALFRDVVTLISEMSVDPSTGLPHPSGVVERALRESGFAVKPDKTAKVQALDALGMLRETSALSIDRARMRLRLSVPESSVVALETALKRMGATIESRTKKVVTEYTSSTTTGPKSARVKEGGGGDGDGDVRGKESGETPPSSEASVGFVVLVDPSDYREILPLVETLSASNPALGAVDVIERHARGEGVVEGGGRGGGGGGGGGEGAGDEDGGGKKVVSVEEVKRVVVAACEFGCKTCRIALESRAEVRDHMRTDFHRINLKRKVKKLPPISEDEFGHLSPEEVEELLTELL